MSIFGYNIRRARRLGRRRVLMLLLLFSVLVPVATLLLPKHDNTIGTAQNDDLVRNALVSVVLPSMCTMQAHIDAGETSAASNVFWDQVHTGAHILAARLDASDAVAGEAFRLAKGQVERDLATLSIVPLRVDVPAFLERVRAAYSELGLAQTETSCP